MVFQHCSSVRAHCSQSLGNKQKNLEYLHRGKGMSSYKKSAAATGPPQPLACLLLQLLGKDRASNPHLNPPWRFIYCLMRKGIWNYPHWFLPGFSKSPLLRCMFHSGVSDIATKTSCQVTTAQTGKESYWSNLQVNKFHGWKERKIIL